MTTQIEPLAMVAGRRAGEQYTAWRKGGGEGGYDLTLPEQYGSDADVWRASFRQATARECLPAHDSGVLKAHEMAERLAGWFPGSVVALPRELPTGGHGRSTVVHVAFSGSCSGGACSELVITDVGRVDFIPHRDDLSTTVKGVDLRQLHSLVKLYGLA